MKTITLSSKCFSGARGLSRGAITRGGASAHSPVRRHTGVPQLTVSGQNLGYVEAPQALEGTDVAALHVAMGMRHVLHVDTDRPTASVLAAMLTNEARVTHVASLAQARNMLAANVFSLVIVDPALPDGDARTLLTLLANTPLLVYSAHQPEWRDAQVSYLPKPLTSARQLWLAVSTMLGLPGNLVAGD